MFNLLLLSSKLQRQDTCSKDLSPIFNSLFLPYKADLKYVILTDLLIIYRNAKMSISSYGKKRL